MSGSITAPCVDLLYPVLPVGVATTKPSPRNASKCLSSINTSITMDLIIVDRTLTSFRQRKEVLPFTCTSISRKRLTSIASCSIAKSMSSKVARLKSQYKPASSEYVIQEYRQSYRKPVYRTACKKDPSTTTLTISIAL